jgi:GNAT superfamily N-acetyltransferase
MDAPFLEHPLAFVESAARVLNGRPVELERVSGFVSSPYDRFLNQLFARGPVTATEAASLFGGRPGFVWLEDPDIASFVAYAMTAPTSGAVAAAADVARVASADDVDAWHRVYREVFGSDARGLADWQRVHAALGPDGEDSLVLLLARLDGAPAATGGVYFAHGWAGLYWFTTLDHMRGRGLASTLVRAAHREASSRGIERALLHATPAGRPVYAKAGYDEVRPLPMLVSS